MSYTPTNVEIYLSAFAGCLAGLGAQSQPFVVPGYFAQMADAFAQAVDTAWGDSGFVRLDLDELEAVSEVAWEERSPLPASSTTPGAYSGIASEIVALVRAGTAQVVSQGIDPNPPTSPWVQTGGTGGIIEAVDETASVQAGGGIATGPTAFAYGPFNTAGQTAVCAGGAFNDANGPGATCLGGLGNAISGTSAAVIASYFCTASGTTSACVGSNSCTASGLFSGCYASAGCTASGKAAGCLGGSNNTASGDFSACIGGGDNVQNGSTASGTGAVTLGAAFSVAAGDNSVVQGVGAYASRATQSTLGGGPAVAATDATAVQTSEMVFRLNGVTSGPGTYELIWGAAGNTAFPVTSGKGYTFEIVGTIHDAVTPSIESFGVVSTVLVNAAGAVTVVATNPLFANQGNYTGAITILVAASGANAITISVQMVGPSPDAMIVVRVKFTETN